MELHEKYCIFEKTPNKFAIIFGLTNKVNFFLFMDIRIELIGKPLWKPLRKTSEITLRKLIMKLPRKTF